MSRRSDGRGGADELRCPGRELAADSFHLQRVDSDVALCRTVVGAGDGHGTECTSFVDRHLWGEGEIAVDGKM